MIRTIAPEDGSQESGPLGTTNYLYDGANIVQELDGAGGTLARYTQAQNIDEPLAELRSSTTTYYQADGLGSITSLTNSSATIAATYSYDAFGNLSSFTGSVTNPFRYTGREYDAETSLHFYRARYYDQGRGRFLGEDPLGFGADLGSFYRYVKNQPTYFRDPTGQLSIGPGFTAQCLADLLSAIDIAKQHANNPACNCWFGSHGLHLPLFVLLDLQPYTLSYDANGNSSPNERNTLAYTNPGDPFHIFITPNGCNSGPTHIAQDIVHEFGHLTLGHWLPWYQHLSDAQELQEHNKVRILENTCGFAVQLRSGPSETVTVTAK